MFKVLARERAPSVGAALIVFVTAVTTPFAGQAFPSFQPDNPVQPVAIQAPEHAVHVAGRDVPGRNLSQPVLSPFGISCAPSIRLTRSEDAFLALDLNAPCQLNQPVRVLHGALSFDAQTSNVGAMNVRLPALRRDGSVTVRFGDGSVLHASLPVAEITRLRRVVLDHDGPSEVVTLAASGPKRHMKRETFGTAGGSVTSLTAPAEGGTVRLALHLSVTKDNCGRPFKARLIEQGVQAEVQKTHLSLNLPDCDRVGEVLVLKNVLPDLTLVRY